MADHAPRSGGCLCGAVRMTATPSRLEMDVCHCSRCRRWSGGVFMTIPCEADASFEGAVGAFRSSDYGERLFCTECGSTLAWRMLDGSMTAVSMQAFDDISGFAFTGEIFIDEKPAIYSFAEKTHKMTGAEVFAQFGAPSVNG